MIEEIIFNVLKDDLRNTWFYQKIFKEGYEIGCKEGIAEVIRANILKEVQKCFPNIIELARRRVEIMHNRTSLDKLYMSILMTRSSEEAEQIFRDLQEV